MEEEINQENQRAPEISPQRLNLYAGFLKILFFLVVFGIGNAVLYFWPEIFNQKETEEFKNINNQMEQLKSRTGELKERLNLLEPELAESNSAVENCKAEVNKFEYQANDGTLTPDVYSQYEETRTGCNRNVDRHNSLVTEYQPVYDEYKQSFEEYNNLVPRQNELAKTVGTRHILIPIPGHHTRSSK
jgi:DNA repair exonuclease SbcCD ATPase subunit